MTTTAPLFHPRAASAALAKFEPQKRRTERPRTPGAAQPGPATRPDGASAELVYGAAHPVPASGGNDPPRHRAQHPKRDDALGFAEVAVNLLMLAAPNLVTCPTH